MTSGIHVFWENLTAPSHMIGHDRCKNEAKARVIRPYETFEIMSLNPDLSLHAALRHAGQIPFFRQTP